MANIQNRNQQRVTTIPELLAEAAEYNCLMDPQQFEAAKVYLLYLILQQLGGLDDTDLCELRDLVKSYDYLSNYQRQAIWIQMLSWIAEQVGVDDSQTTTAVMRQKLACWCSTSKQSLDLLEILLLYSILSEFTLD